MNKQEVLTKYRLKKEACNRWKQVQVIQEQCRNAVLVCRDGVRKAKAHLELILVRVKKVFYMCYQLGKTGKNISPLPNGTGALVASDAVRPRCSIFFAPVFTGKISLQEYQASETRGQVWSKKAYHWLRRSSIKDIKVSSICTSPWNPLVHAQESWRSAWHHCKDTLDCPWKVIVIWGRILRTEIKQASLLAPSRANRKIWVNTGLSASPRLSRRDCEVFVAEDAQKLSGHRNQLSVVLHEQGAWTGQYSPGPSHLSHAVAACDSVWRIIFSGAPATPILTSGSASAKWFMKHGY